MSTCKDLSRFLDRIKNSKDDLSIEDIVTEDLAVFNLSEVFNILSNLQDTEKPEKSCGNCKRFVKKEDEYNLILCPHCNKYFCWLCGKSLRKEKDNPKSHYDPNKYPKSSCRNKLINQEEVKKKQSLSSNWLVSLEKLYETADFSIELEKLCKLVEAKLMNHKAG